MSQWKTSDNTAGMPKWVAQSLNLGSGPTAQVANNDALHANVTPSGFIPGQTVGVFGADTTELAIGVGPVQSAIIDFAGSGYNANATVTVTGDGSSATANATANSLGNISAVNITAGGTGYTRATIAVAAPFATFNANTGVNNAGDFITVAGSQKFAVGEPLTYTVPTNNTAISGLTNNTVYYVSFANATVLALANSVGGANINITASAVAETHTLTGANTATAKAVVGGAKNKGVAHAGWVLRRVGSGGRAGRVQYETLVAMGSISTDASDDTVLPDA